MSTITDGVAVTESTDNTLATLRFAQQLRTVADFYEATPDAPLPYFGFRVHTYNRKSFIDAARRLGATRIVHEDRYVLAVRDLDEVSLSVAAEPSHLRGERAVPPLTDDETAALTDEVTA